MKTLDEEEPAQKESHEAEDKASKRHSAHPPHLLPLGLHP